MAGRSAVLVWPSTGHIAFPFLLLLRAGIILLAVAAGSVGWAAAQALSLSDAPVHVASSVADTRAPLMPNAPLRVTLEGHGTQLAGAYLVRGDGTGKDLTVPTRLVPDGAHAWLLQAPDGASPLRTDGDYRLVVQATVTRPAFPMPRTQTIERQYRFSTSASPRAVLPTDTLRPRWGEAVSIDWSQPMASVSIQVRPPAPFTARVDERQPTRVWLEAPADQLTPGQTYEVTVIRARSVSGLDLQAPATLAVAVPTRPRVTEAPSQPVTLREGQSVTLTTSEPVTDLRLVAPSDWPMDVQVEGTRITIRPRAYLQGRDVAVTLSEATSLNGAPLERQVALRLRTAPAFAAPTIQPTEESGTVPVSARPTITFPEPVADRAAVERSLAIEPPVEGAWRWLDAQQVEFVPAARLPELTDLTLTVRGGPDGPRTAAGGFIEGDTAASFRTGHFKRLEVSLSRQEMYLLEDNKRVRTIRVATGVRGAETPTGTFEVLYKMPQAHFRGVNPSGLRYDIPDVKWVLPFWGDYSIHGAHWRSVFGAPGSNGCVSMTDADAKVVYDWAEVGTPITIYD